MTESLRCCTGRSKFDEGLEPKLEFAGYTLGSSGPEPKPEYAGDTHNSSGPEPEPEYTGYALHSSRGPEASANAAPPAQLATPLCGAAQSCDSKDIESDPMTLGYELPQKKSRYSTSGLTKAALAFGLMLILVWGLRQILLTQENMEASEQKAADALRNSQHRVASLEDKVKAYALEVESEEENDVSRRRAATVQIASLQKQLRQSQTSAGLEKGELAKEQQTQESQKKSAKIQAAFMQKELENLQETVEREKRELKSEQQQLSNSQKVIEQKKEKLAEEQEAQFSREEVKESQIVTMKHELEKAQNFRIKQKEQLAREQNQVHESQMATEKEKKELAKEKQIQYSQEESSHARIASLQGKFQKSQETLAKEQEELERLQRRKQASKSQDVSSKGTQQQQFSQKTAEWPKSNSSSRVELARRSYPSKRSFSLEEELADVWITCSS